MQSSEQPLRRMLYLIGQPGAGKTSLMTLALADLEARDITQPVPHVLYHVPTSETLSLLTGIQLGFAREQFGGTDALAMNAQPKVVEWLTDPAFPYSYVVAEGDRLGNAKFFSALRSSRWTLDVLYLSTPDEVAAQRRDQRGSHQNEAWLKGRQTKVQNLAGDYCSLKPGTVLDGTLPLNVLVSLLRVHPVMCALRGEA